MIVLSPPVGNEAAPPHPANDTPFSADRPEIAPTERRGSGRRPAGRTVTAMPRRFNLHFCMIDFVEMLTLGGR
jgi:hypothetical protein